mmetsp:Transcript_15414/g.33939  ORF Transcript_15414/g.33939 Transcript_15414/m.33939 type:complete len:210 (+) Transcript_15414:931-1560(+)
MSLTSCRRSETSSLSSRETRLSSFQAISGSAKAGAAPEAAPPPPPEMWPDRNSALHCSTCPRTSATIFRLSARSSASSLAKWSTPHCALAALWERAEMSLPSLTILSSAPSITSPNRRNLAERSFMAIAVEVVSFRPWVTACSRAAKRSSHCLARIAICSCCSACCSSRVWRRDAIARCLSEPSFVPASICKAAVTAFKAPARSSWLLL